MKKIQTVVDFREVVARFCRFHQLRCSADPDQMSSRHFVVLADVRYEESENGDACELYEKQWILDGGLGGPSA